MIEESPYAPPLAVDSEAMSKSISSKRRRIEQLTLASILLLGVILISIPTIVPPGDRVRNLVAIVMAFKGLTCLIKAFLK